VSGGDFAIWGFKDGSAQSDGVCGAGTYDLVGAAAEPYFACQGAPFGTWTNKKGLLQDQNRVCGNVNNQNDQNECKWSVQAPLCDCEANEKICPSEC
jgi:hypothetical protein